MKPSWIDDRQRRETVVSGCEPAINGNQNGWSVKDAEGWSLWVPGDICDQTPKAGESFLQFGEGIGRPVRGIVIGGRTYKYQTAKEEAQRHKEWCRDLNEKRQRQLDENKADRDTRIAALPDPLRLRVERFQRVKPDFRRDHEPYELFCCEEAVKLQAALPTRAEIAAFHKLSYEEQKERVPGMAYDQHSGNTFGFSCTLAALLADSEPDNVVKMHGALCGMLGCEDYGCFAGHEGKDVHNDGKACLLDGAP